MKNTIFIEKTLADYSLLLHQRTPLSQISLQRKLAQIATKPQNSRKFSFLKVFFLESFVPYGSHWTSNLERTELLGTLLQALPTKLIAAVQDFCLQYDCKTEFEGENFHEFCSFVAIHESFLCKILRHGVLWRSTSEQSTKVFFVKITNLRKFSPLKVFCCTVA